MSVWSQFLLNDSISPSIELLSLFHDYSLSVILYILFFVSGVTIYIVYNRFSSSFVVVMFVEAVWTLAPVFIVLSLAFPSLYFLYDIYHIDSYLASKVEGRGWWYWGCETMNLDLESDYYEVSFSSLEGVNLFEVDPRVVLPVQKNVRILDIGGGVMHCWSLPSIKVSADMVPGRFNQVSLNSIRSGTSYGQPSGAVVGGGSSGYTGETCCGSFWRILCSINPFNLFRSSDAAVTSGGQQPSVSMGGGSGILLDQVSVASSGSGRLILDHVQSSSSSNGEGVSSGSHSSFITPTTVLVPRLDDPTKYCYLIVDGEQPSTSSGLGARPKFYSGN